MSHHHAKRRPCEREVCSPHGSRYAVSPVAKRKASDEGWEVLEEGEMMVKATRRQTRGMTYPESHPLCDVAHAAEWTQEEDEALRESVRVNGGKSWKRIATFLPGRSDVQCLNRWHTVLKPTLVRGTWTQEEDDVLRELVAVHGAAKWSSIAKMLNERLGTYRLGKQCRERWTNHLDPTITRTEWTEEEDALLLAEQESIGNKWSDISKKLPGRTENAVKNRWNSLKRKIWQEEFLSQQHQEMEALMIQHHFHTLSQPYGTPQLHPQQHPQHLNGATPHTTGPPTLPPLGCDSPFSAQGTPSHTTMMTMDTPFRAALRQLERQGSGSGSGLSALQPPSYTSQGSFVSLLSAAESAAGSVGGGGVVLAVHPSSSGHQTPQEGDAYPLGPPGVNDEPKSGEDRQQEEDELDMDVDRFFATRAPPAPVCEEAGTDTDAMRKRCVAPPPALSSSLRSHSLTLPIPSRSPQPTSLTPSSSGALAEWKLPLPDTIEQDLSGRMTRLDLGGGGMSSRVRAASWKGRCVSECDAVAKELFRHIDGSDEWEGGDIDEGACEPRPLLPMTLPPMAPPLSPHLKHLPYPTPTATASVSTASTTNTPPSAHAVQIGTPVCEENNENNDPPPSPTPTPAPSLTPSPTPQLPPSAASLAQKLASLLGTLSNMADNDRNRRLAEGACKKLESAA
ncbi:unnamed protein product [Vitrella brassicaformis CCMP3155]|uniref:Uncharacterized protein n=1 Tax=Vitrella brassicaformis (strain CCMP3155) TaxID=1169540 RepID=A0A0G4EAJ6_VITBC|nr:unnamed protein product [Vitrella brassicaformis CCMP3155]|eukprot:CEL92647.1 unnamed protein product [Vitrella brassicaformis CCMP3155]